MRTERTLLGMAAALALCVVVPQQAVANVIVNGDFSDAGSPNNIPNWTIFETPYGDAEWSEPFFGIFNYPEVVSFDTTTSGVFSNSARFRVGINTWQQGPQGGGIYQVVNVVGGTYSFSVDIAAYVALDAPGAGTGNGDAGTFSLYLGDTLIDSHFFGEILTGQTLRSQLTGTLDVAGGSHEVRLLMTRSFSNSAGSPYQFLDNISMVLQGTPSPVPEPASLALLLIGVGLTGLAAGSRRCRRLNEVH